MKLCALFRMLKILQNPFKNQIFQFLQKSIMLQNYIHSLKIVRRERKNSNSNFVFVL